MVVEIKAAQYKEIKDLADYARHVAKSKSAGNSQKVALIEQWYVRVTGDTKINLGCTRCFINKVAPRVVIMVDEYEARSKGGRPKKDEGTE